MNSLTCTKRDLMYGGRSDGEGARTQNSSLIWQFGTSLLNNATSWMNSRVSASHTPSNLSPLPASDTTPSWSQPCPPVTCTALTSHPKTPADFTNPQTNPTASLNIIRVLLQEHSETLCMVQLLPAAWAHTTSCPSGNATTSISKQVAPPGSIFDKLGLSPGSRQSFLRLMWKRKLVIRLIVRVLTLTFAVVVICSAFVGDFRSFCSIASSLSLFENVLVFCATLQMVRGWIIREDRRARTRHPSRLYSSGPRA